VGVLWSFRPGLEVVVDSEKLYTPQTSRAFEDRDFAESHFDTATQRTVFIFAEGNSVASNAASKASLLELYDMVNESTAVLAK
jgi:hypothetical protein